MIRPPKDVPMPDEAADNRPLAGLRLVLLDPLDPAQPVAERELALRMAASIRTLGGQAWIVNRSDQIAGHAPDAVFCLHPQAVPKLTAHPWLACYWNPPSLLPGPGSPARHHGLAHEVTHDAYLLSGGPALAAHLAGRLAAVGRVAPTMPFHVSSPRSTLAPNPGPHSRLFYIGSNWDGRRFPMLLDRLAQAGALALYGDRQRWAHLPAAYQGPLPFDGVSVIRAAHHWGMGLCLHLPQHRADGIPNMRTFELAAAGALIIADRHPFIEQWFGDTVLYVDVTGGETAMADAILDRVAWAQAHPVQARTMAQAAQDIFNRHLCLEALLEPLPSLLRPLQPLRPSPPGNAHAIAVLLPEGPDLADRLLQVAAQQADGLRLTALLPPGLDTAPVPPGLAVRRLPAVPCLPALQVAMADALAILPPGIIWHPGHLARLAAGGRDMALAAGLWPRPPAPTGFATDPAEPLALAPLVDRAGTDNCRLAQGLLRAGGLYCRAAALDGLALVPSMDWLGLALLLPPALVERGELAYQPLPSLQLNQLPPVDPARLATLPPWPDAEAVMEGGIVPPHITGISDLDPDLAASIPWLWRLADFDRLPGDGPIWLYGAGQGGDLVHDALPPTALSRLAGFLDSRQRGHKHGLPLCRPQDVPADALAGATIIIAAQYVSDILRTLRAGPIQPAHVLNAFPYIADCQAAARVAGPV
jgi:hypothetical protein